MFCIVQLISFNEIFVFNVKQRLKPKKVAVVSYQWMSIKFLESSVYWSDRDLTGEDYIADINKNWFVRARTALCCFHNIVLFPLYSNKIYFYKPWIRLAFVFAFVNNTITFLNLIVFEVVPARNAIRVPENLPQNCSYRTSKSYQSDENTTKMYF